MWKPEHRIAADRSGLRYPSDLTGAEWAIVGNVTQAPRKNGQEQAAQEKAATPPPARPDTNVVPMPTMGKRKEHDPLSVRRK